MKSLYRSSATVDTHPASSAAHNCPSCRCRSSDLSLKLKPSVSQPFLSHRQQEPNLYLSNHLSEAASEPSRPFLSAIFTPPSQKITFKYAAAVSPKQANISFSYTSPPKSRKPHSSDAKFSTRRFKNTHFPQISQEDDSVPVRKIIKGGKEGKEVQGSSPYYEVFSGEKTPEKHRVLKMKKEKSKQKLEITLSKKSSSSAEQEELPRCHDPHNDYQFEAPRNTPINALWMASSDRTQKSIKQEEAHRFLNRELAPASIQHIQHAQALSRKEIPLINNPAPPPLDSLQQLLLPAHRVPSKEASSHRKYPTIESLEAYEARAYVEGVSKRAQEETSLRFLRESEKEPSVEEVELARSISEQLSLHYDYYYPQEDSDPSLSLHVTL